MPERSDNELRRLYGEALRLAMRHASVHVDRDGAQEIAHHVASALVRRVAAADPGDAPIESIDAFVHRSVLNRVRDLWRRDRRRIRAEGVWEGERGEVAPVWCGPDAVLESAELHRVIEDAVAAMPEAMRAVFGLIRRDRLSYKDAAARLGVGVGTVHTHLSRANAVLRRVVGDYLAAGEGNRNSAEQSQRRGVRK